MAGLEGLPRRCRLRGTDGPTTTWSIPTSPTDQRTKRDDERVRRDSRPSDSISTSRNWARAPVVPGCVRQQPRTLSIDNKTHRSQALAADRRAISYGWRTGAPS